ncbi:hypothetical protein [Actinomadura chokoriensis]|uniref:hypothetical protein n=1 Tax=Actinomadura chokoriensis TaxID=454156 RepID=UPI0031F95BEA
MNTAYGNIDCGVSIILAAPFITELSNPSWLPRLTHRCQAKGVDVTSNVFKGARYAAAAGWFGPGMRPLRAARPEPVDRPAAQHAKSLKRSHDSVSFQRCTNLPAMSGASSPSRYVVDLVEPQPFTDQHDFSCFGRCPIRFRTG